MNTLENKLVRLAGIAYFVLILYAVGADMTDGVQGAFIGLTAAALMID